MSTTAPRIIHPGECYPTSEVTRIAGWGPGALRTARKNGIIVRYLHGRAFIFGDDLLTYLRENAATEPPTTGKKGEQN